MRKPWDDEPDEDYDELGAMWDADDRAYHEQKEQALFDDDLFN